MDPPEIRNAEGERLACSFVPGEPGRRDIVVIGHGLTSDKERPWSEGLSDSLRRRGIASLRIAFSGNGDSEGSFLKSNITKEVCDLGSVLDALDPWKVSYVGHSMGGAVGLLRAASDPRIGALVSLAAITHTTDFFKRLFGDQELGSPMLGKPHCLLGEDLRTDLLSIGSTLQQASTLSIPWLIVHGSADEIVPVQDSVDLNMAANGPAELTVLDTVDHSFSADGLASMLERVTPWLERTMAR
ncbi:MAG: pimeloyl-ACP methyl ester carboxylesterase [Planctomycetota bacterium]|jgi:pimeloyl-ACP methyl ester carboxylesterase